MAPSTRKTANEQRADQRATGVAKPQKGKSKEEVKNKWTKQDEKAKSAQVRMENQDSLALLNQEIEELENRPDGHEKRILLAGARARKQNMAGRPKDATTVDSIDEANIHEAPDVEMANSQADNTANNVALGERQRAEARNDRQTDIIRRDGHGSIEGKVSVSEDANNMTEKVVHDVSWHIRDGSPKEASDISNGQPVPIGYRKKGSGRTYLVRHGTADSCSTCFESSPGLLPENFETSLLNVSYEGDRIIEKIIAWHREKRQPVPDHVLSKAQILSVYWDTKKTLGANVKDELYQVLGPKPPLRTSVRCVVYLDPKLYKDKGWGVKNLSGISHETRTTMLTCINGISREDREIELFNVAVRLENRYQRRFQPTQAALHSWARLPSVTLKTLRRGSPRRTPVRQPVHEGRHDELSEDSDSDEGGFEEPTKQTPRKSRQEASPITEDALLRILETFTTNIEKRIDTLVDQITEKVLERIRKEERYSPKRQD